MILEKEERLALLLMCAVLLAIAGAHFVLGGADKYDFASVYTNTSQEGELVKYNGTVLSVSATKTGGHLIIDAGRDSPADISPKEKPETEIVLFVSGGAALKSDIDKGDNISAVGKVSIYNGHREIMIEKLSDISVFKQDNGTQAA